MINQYLLICAFPHIELKADFSCAESFDFASNIASYLIHSKIFGFRSLHKYCSVWL